jgi:hypothetical protein
VIFRALAVLARVKTEKNGRGKILRAQVDFEKINRNAQQCMEEV